MENLLPACKNAGVTHLTGSCTRVHHAEWSIGEAAGLLAAFSHAEAVAPRAVYEQERLRTKFLALVEAQGMERHWPRIVTCT